MKLILKISWEFFWKILQSFHGGIIILTIYKSAVQPIATLGIVYSVYKPFGSLLYSIIS